MVVLLELVVVYGILIQRMIRKKIHGQVPGEESKNNEIESKEPRSASEDAEAGEVAEA